jgi:hypothetical protein
MNRERLMFNPPHSLQQNSPCWFEILKEGKENPDSRQQSGNVPCFPNLICYYTQEGRNDIGWLLNKVICCGHGLSMSTLQYVHLGGKDYSLALKKAASFNAADSIFAPPHKQNWYIANRVLHYKCEFWR